MQLFLLSLITAVIPLTTASWFQNLSRKKSYTAPQQNCYTANATCVPIEFCPSIYRVLKQHLKGHHHHHHHHHHRTERPKAVTCRQCKQNDGQQISVRCEPEDLTKGNDCVTAANVRGQCLPEDYCHLRQPVATSQHTWYGHHHHRQEKTCFEEDTKNYYCCPWPSQSQRPIPDGSIENVYPKCRDSRRLLGRCVPVPQCNHLSRIKNSNTRESFIRKNLCPSNDKEGRSICCASTSSDHVNWIKHPKAARLGMQNCGPVSMAENMFRGTTAGLGQYPWMVNLLYREWNKYRVKGAGTLIHPRYILTAAHAVTKNLKKVRLGDYDLSRRLDCEDGRCAQPAQEYSIHKKMVHEMFSMSSWKRKSDHDIALLELYRDVELFPQQIYPICLPLTETLLMLQPRQMTVTGWGASDRPTSVLQEAELSVVDRDDGICPGESTFCARGKDYSGHCQGDSGGPYQALVPVGAAYRYVQFGVISAGSRDCIGTKLVPSVGVGVAYHINWMLDRMNI